MFARNWMPIVFSILWLALVSACATPTTIPPTASPTAQPTASNPSPRADAPKPKEPKSQEPKPQPTTAAQSVTPVPTANRQPVQDQKQQPTPAPSNNPNFFATEILGRPTNNSVTVNVVPNKNLEIYFEYGTTTGNFTNQTAQVTANANAPIESLIDKLAPNTRYFYRARYRQPGSAPFATGIEHSFVTQRTPGSSFAFSVQGDSHPERQGKQFDPALYTRALQTAASDQPDFYMLIGDDFSVDTLKTINVNTVTERYTLQREYLGLIGSASPLFLVNGNHEQAAMANLNGTPNNVAVWAQLARNKYYPQPAPDNFYTGDAQPVEHIGLLRDYYAWTWGDALFVVIDPYWHSTVVVDNVLGGGTKRGNMWDITLGDAQYKWFKQTLEQSNAKYKFVFTHHVLGTGRGGIELAKQFEWGDAANFAARRPGWELPIHQLMVKNGVTIFFQGHDHIFVKQELDGVIYQSLPEPANPFYSWENEDAYKTGNKFPNSGYVRVNVSPAQTQVEYVRVYQPKDETNGRKTGEVAFSYTVAPKTK